MATAKKHMERSHYSYHKRIPTSMFANKAIIKMNAKANIQKSSILQKLFHRKTKPAGENISRKGGKNDDNKV